MVEEVREVEREREERADRERAVDDERTAESEDDCRRNRREDVYRREVHAAEQNGLVVRLAVALVDAAEGGLTRRLARERLDDAHSGYVFREGRGDEAEPLANPSVGSIRASPKPHGHKRHERKHDESRECEPPVEQEQDDRGAHKYERVLDEAGDAVRHQLVECLDVVRDPADDRSGAVSLVVAE
jgi:hypothetical protein